MYTICERWSAGFIIIHFLLNFIIKKMPSIRVVQLLYTIVYILLYFYTYKTNFFFFFFSSTQVSCFVVTVPWLADRYFQEEVNGGADNRWTVTTHPLRQRILLHGRAWRSCFSASPFLHLECVFSCPVMLGRLRRGTPGCRDWSTLTSSFAGLLGLSDN